MKSFKITLVFIFFLSTNLFAEDISVIELHSSSDDGDVKQNEVQQEERCDRTVAPTLASAP